MSRKNNINMDHYKTRGRGRQGEGVVHEDYTRLRNQVTSQRRRGLSARQLMARKIRLRARSANAKQNAADITVASQISEHDQRDGAPAVA